MNLMKTFFLMIGLMTLAVIVGRLMGGEQGMVAAFLFAAAMNFFTYFFSDKMVLAMHRAKAVSPSEHSELYRMVEGLCRKAGLPMPKLYLLNDASPNAFATGRNPNHAAVAVTRGILDLLPPKELEAVLAHELTHVKNRDILIMTIAATLSGVIMMLCNWMFFFFGGRDRDRNPIVMIFVMLLAPIAATLVQLAISRSREYDADLGAARLTSKEAMKNALRRIHEGVRARPMLEASPSAAHLFIANPFGGRKIELASLFMTHPTLEQRLAALERAAV